MPVVYIIRAPGTGHSIEGVFDPIRRVVQASGVEAAQVYLPHVSRGIRSIWRNLRYVRALVRNYPTNTIFHVTGDIHYAVLALPASRTVLTIHDGSLLIKNRTRPLRFAVFWLFWYYWPVWRAGRLTVISEKTRQELIQDIGRVGRKAVVVANGVDPLFRPTLRPFCKDRPVLLQVGTAPNKNLLRLIVALDAISCTLVIVGPLATNQLDALAQHGIDYRNYTDLSRATLVSLYESCDIVTFVSTYEGFGMPVLEANAVGRVVLTSAIAPFTDFAPDTAHFVDPTNIPAIRDGILRLIHDDTYRQTLISAGQRNARRYSVAAVAVRYQMLYRA